MVNQAEDYEIEPIPNEDSVSRGCNLPPGIAPESLFPFSSSSEWTESVYWRKYAQTTESVHERGCKRAEISNERRAQKGQLLLKYIGAKTAGVGAIRHLKTDRGFSITVEHFPENCDRAHAHLCIVHATCENQVKSKPKPNDRLVLVNMLSNICFGALENHNCN